MKAITLLVILIFSNAKCFAQSPSEDWQDFITGGKKWYQYLDTTTSGLSLKDDWKDFKSEKWQVKTVSQDSIQTAQQVCGYIVFQNSRDTTLKVSYSIFKTSDFDSTSWQKIVLDYAIISGCNIITWEGNLSSFSDKGYYYRLSHCDICSSDAKPADCVDLKIALNQYSFPKR